MLSVWIVAPCFSEGARLDGGPCADSLRVSLMFSRSPGTTGVRMRRAPCRTNSARDEQLHRHLLPLRPQAVL